MRMTNDVARRRGRGGEEEEEREGGEEGEHGQRLLPRRVRADTTVTEESVLSVTRRKIGHSVSLSNRRER